MKRLTRYLLVLLCFLLLSTVFSLSASAETVSDYIVLINTTYKDPPFHSNYGVGTDLYVYPNDNEVQKNPVTSSVHLDNGFYVRHLYGFFNQYNETLIEKDKLSVVNLDNLYYSTFVEGDNVYHRTVSSIYVGLRYADGDFDYFREEDFVKYTQNGAIINAEFEIKPRKDVTKIELFIEGYYNQKSAKMSNITQYLGEYDGDGKYQFSLDVESKEAGLLKTVINWLSNIKSGITDLFESITELPSKLWNLISEGLKSLFVPTEDYITQFKTDMENLLAEKLGAVYQVLDITFNSWDRIQDNDTANIINLPKTTINLPNNNTFSFGGYDIKIVPEGFEFIVTILKTIVGIVCTILFINGLRRRYDEIMGVEK